MSNYMSAEEVPEFLADPNSFRFRDDKGGLLERDWVEWTNDRIKRHKRKTTSFAVRYYGVLEGFKNYSFEYLKLEC